MPFEASSFIKSQQVGISFILKRALAFARLGIQSTNQKDERLLLKNPIRGRCDLFRHFQGDSKALRLWTPPGKTISYSHSNAMTGFIF